jgi:Na+/H+ antiporter NhaD/arsenite permease-like protein
VTASNIILKLIVPSVACLLVPLLVMQILIKGNFKKSEEAFDNDDTKPTTALQRKIVFFAGVGILLSVPIFKTVTHLPPFMGMLIGLGIMWIISEIVHSDKDEQERKHFTVSYALRKIDSPSILFFLGILLAVASLESTGQLVKAAGWFNDHLRNQNTIAMAIGLLSSIVDNVPLVAAAMGMYDMNQFPTDHYFWEFLAYTTGTGGSVLIIGSAAGVAAMGLEKINFIWYLKRVSWLALLGFFSGAAVYILQETIF